MVARMQALGPFSEGFSGTLGKTGSKPKQPGLEPHSYRKYLPRQRLFCCVMALLLSSYYVSPSTIALEVRVLSLEITQSRASSLSQLSCQ